MNFIDNFLDKIFDQLALQASNAKLILKQFSAKNLGIICGGKNPNFDQDPKHRIVGVWTYCSNCKWFGFTDVIDPWSYNSHSDCENCYARIDYSPRQIFGFSLAYINMKHQILSQRPSNKNKLMTFAKCLWQSRTTEEIPEHQEGKTWSELERDAVLKISVAWLLQ